MPNPAIRLTIGLLSIALSCGSAPAASLLLDTQFRAPLFAEPHTVVRTLLQPDGNFYLFFDTDTLTDVRSGAITRFLPDGTLDTSFNFSRSYKVVDAAALAPNGQLVIAVIQYTYGTSVGTEQLLRLNTDGSIDPSFTISIVQPYPSNSVRSILVQPDGNTLVVGSFTDFGGSGRQKIVRLLADGTIDPSFNPPEFSGGFYGIYPKPVLTNGKIIVTGDFSQVNGVANLGVAQLNSDGSLDTSFQALGFTRYTSGIPIRGLGTTSDGKIIIAGRFRIGSGPGAPRPQLLRLNSDGSLDSSYLPTLSDSSDIARDLVIQSDDKAIAALSGYVFRIDTNGVADPTFTVPLCVDASSDPYGELGITYTLGLQPDGRILVAGAFTDINPAGNPGLSHFGIVRLNSDGTVDPSLVMTHRTGFEDFPTSFARLTDGSVLSSFRVSSQLHDPTMPFNFGRLLPDGSVDPAFTLSSADPGGILSMGFIAKDFIRMVDGEFFVFEESYGGAKFHSNGYQDLSFQFSGGPFQEATTTLDDKVLLSAGTSPDATIWGPLSRMRRDGSLDSTLFLPEVHSSQVIYDQTGLSQLFVGSHVLAVQPNGKILFIYFASDQFFHFVRLNQDGSQDDSFPAVTLDPINLVVDFPYVFDPYAGGYVQPFGGAWSATAPIQDAHVLPDGRIILCGLFTSYNGIPARRVVRLFPDGTTDSSFDVGGGAQWTTTTETSSFFPAVEALEEQVDGKLLIAGTFEAFNGIPLPGIASLNPDGSVDESFIPPAERQKFAKGTAKLARQPDGSFLLSGPYSFPGESDPAFIHINSVGGIPVVGSPPQATAIIGQPFNYQIEASGQPTSYNATGLPPGFTIDPNTGAITGTPNSGNVGIYVIFITATNDDGTSATFYLTLTVAPSSIGPFPTLQNISTRLKVLAGDNALIGGFIISGYSERRVIVRAIGPSLTGLGVSGALANPVLELHGPDGFVTITNDNWRDTQQTEIEATGIAPSNDLESAIVATLQPGAYTAIVRGISDGIGVGLVEAYDLESTPYAQLANISTRGFVDNAENVMIGGLIAGPSTAGSGRVLIRAIGPSLSNVGVPNTLQNPMLELHDSNGGLIAFNNNWKETQEFAIQATGIAPTDDNEAAILTVLAPGSYTAVVQGEDEGIGVGLVEVYNLQ